MDQISFFYAKAVQPNQPDMLVAVQRRDPRISFLMQQLGQQNAAYLPPNNQRLFNSYQALVLVLPKTPPLMHRNETSTIRLIDTYLDLDLPLKPEIHENQLIYIFGILLIRLNSPLFQNPNRLQNAFLFSEYGNPRVVSLVTKYLLPHPFEKESILNNERLILQLLNKNIFETRQQIEHFVDQFFAHNRINHALESRKRKAEAAALPQDLNERPKKRAKILPT